eukprot:COSAG01_NODE_39044_length_481_cov_8.465969_1_plen_30_part_10
MQQQNQPRAGPRIIIMLHRARARARATVPS